MAIEQLQNSSPVSERVQHVDPANHGVEATNATQGKRLVYVIGTVILVVALSFWHLGLAAVTGATGLTLAFTGRS